MDIEEKIAEVLEGFERDYCDSTYYSEYNDDGESMSEAIEALLKESGIEQFDVYGDQLFDSPGYDTGHVSVAWIEDGKLYLRCYQWEGM